MTLRAWLRERSPTPPPRLLERIESTLGDACDRPRAEAAALCLAAAESLLADLLGRPTAGRESALDLLTVDALVTYSFEAAAEESEHLAVFAEDAMSRLSAVAR